MEKEDKNSVEPLSLEEMLEMNAAYTATTIGSGITYYEFDCHYDRF